MTASTLTECEEIQPQIACANCGEEHVRDDLQWIKVIVTTLSPRWDSVERWCQACIASGAGHSDLRLESTGAPA